MSLVVVLGSVNAACINFRPPPPRIPATDAGDAPREVWSRTATGRLTAPLAIEEGTLYAGSINRRVYAVDLETGEARWSRRLGGALLGGLLKSGDRLYTATERPDGKVYALDSAKGQTRWKRSVGATGVPLALLDGLLVAATRESGVFGLDPATGDVRWHVRVGPARAAPVAAGAGAVLVTTLDSIYRLSLESGRILRRAPAPGPVLGGWVRLGDLLVAGTADSQVVALRPDSLGVAWRARVDAPVLTAPAIRGDTAVVATRRGTVYRIVAGPDPAAHPLATLEWPVTAAPAYVGGLLVLGGADGVIRGLRADGTEAWRVGVWRPVELSPLPLDDGMVAIGGSGDFHRYRR